MLHFWPIYLDKGRHNHEGVAEFTVCLSYTRRCRCEGQSTSLPVSPTEKRVCVWTVVPKQRHSVNIRISGWIELQPLMDWIQWRNSKHLAVRQAALEAVNETISVTSSITITRHWYHLFLCHPLTVHRGLRGLLNHAGWAESNKTELTF